MAAGSVAVNNDYMPLKRIRTTVARRDHALRVGLPQETGRKRVAVKGTVETVQMRQAVCSEVETT